MPASRPPEWPYVIRHHWVVIFSSPGRFGWVVLGLLVIFPIVAGWLAWVPLVLVLAALFGFRYQEWRAETIELDPRTIRHARGVAETTASSAFLRVDRIAGAVLSRTVPGKLLGYGTLHLEAPGSHPDFRKLSKIERPEETFALLESLMLRHGPMAGEAWDSGGAHPHDIGSGLGEAQRRTAEQRETAPLPRLDRDPSSKRDPTVAPRLPRWRP
jgi:hypothetical protein